MSESDKRDELDILAVPPLPPGFGRPESLPFFPVVRTMWRRWRAERRAKRAGD